MLHRLPYLAALSPTALSAIAAASVIRSYRAGEMLLIEDDPCPGLLIVRSGRLKASLLSPGGREHILDIYGPGEAVNEAEALAGIASATTIAALDDASVLMVGCSALTPLLDQLTPAARAVVQALGGRCRHLVTVVADLSLRPVTAGRWQPTWAPCARWSAGHCAISSARDSCASRRGRSSSPSVRRWNAWRRDADLLRQKSQTHRRQCAMLSRRG